MALEIQSDLQSLSAKVIESLADSNKAMPDLQPLHDWLENDEWDEIVMSILGQFVYLDHIADTFFYDACLRDYIDIDEDEITDQIRIDFAREKIDYAISISEDSVHAIHLYLDQSSSFYLLCVINGQGQGGWEVEWGYVYKTIDELMASFDNYLLIDNHSASDTDIIKLWKETESAINKLNNLIDK
jgi:hypothetical protein